MRRRELEPLRDLARGLVQAAMHTVEGLKSDAVIAENGLFIGFNLPREATGVSLRLAACERDLRQMLQGLDSKVACAIVPGTPPTGCEFDHLLEWFVVE
jgi:hypothetical protein